MYEFASFGLREMIESSRALRALGAKSLCMEEAAREIVDMLYGSFVAKDGSRACALARCFKTHRFSELPGHLREIAGMAMHGAQPSESMPCLTLLATRGLEPEWNDRHASSAHRAIPLATAEMVARAPMIARLVEQMGLEPHDVLHTAADELDGLEKRSLDVFHIEDARGSAFVPAQKEFVEQYGIRSVIGFGGVLPTGDLFFFLMFAVDPIPVEAAQKFRTLAICAKLVLLNHMDKPVFAA